MVWWLLRALHVGIVSLLVVRFLLRPLLHLASRLPIFLDDLLLPHQSYTIPKLNESLQENPLHRKATTFLSSLPSLQDSPHSLLLSSPLSPQDPYLNLSPNHPVHDSFLGAHLSWTLLPDDSLVLRLRRSDRHRVLRPYLQHIDSVAAEVDLTRRDVRLFVNTDTHEETRRKWRAVPFTHPCTMDSLAMDPDLKSRVVLDLDAFLKNKNYYHRLGRVWKRSYLLHGLPGTGKSSFVAAMARYLSYDLYDLDLSRLPIAGGSGSSDLRTLLLQTSPRSVIVVEDVDKHLPAVLPELLNLMDGLFSCCGEERVMVFTMRGGDNGGRNMDPALLRPGRVDVHLHFPLCDFTAFKAMASSYLGLKDHKLYPAVEEVFQSGATMSPAEIGEIMITNRSSPSRALKTVITALRQYPAGGKMVSVDFGGHHRRSGSGDGGGHVAVEDEEEKAAGEVSGVLGSNGAINKEIKKLYGLIRRGSRREGSGGGSGFPPPVPPPSLPPAKPATMDVPPVISEDHARVLSAS